LLLPGECLRLDFLLNETAHLRAQRVVLLAEYGEGRGGGVGEHAVHLNSYHHEAAVTSISIKRSGRAKAATTSVVTAGGASSSNVGFWLR